ncbi:MAG: hypothetical protein JW723_10295 [Bacteroidales bacterium]|nr:hypothetical protein [Bacteroidales bacterium]
MNYIRILLLTFLCQEIISFTSAQENQPKDLITLENQIYKLFQFMSDATIDKDKDLINNDIITNFEKALEIPGSFNYAFDSLKHMGRILSSDQQLRIYTWNIPYQDGTHKYYGYLQYITDKKDQPAVFKLNDQSEKITNPAEAVLNIRNWYGALYYDVITVRDRENKYYTLLGFDFNDIFSSKKMIDILYFNDHNEPVFGKPVFQQEGKLVTRIIFEFSARVSMNLRYHKEKDMIIHDHLSPSRPSLTGKFQFYGPDMSYDGYKFEEGIWKVHKDIDIRNLTY